MEEPVVEAKDLEVGYEGRTVLKDISFSVAHGEIFIILGGSGCGKSTLLKHVIGLYKPFKGDVLIHGESMVKADENEKRRMMKGFGVTYQGGALFGSLTVGENVSLVLEEHTDFPKEKIDEIVDEKLKLVEMDKFRDYMPSEISGGMRKRAGIARAMALEPQLLFFDEPSAGLDPIMSAELDRLILDLSEKSGATMVIVTHELDSIFTIADRVIMLDRESKTIVAEGKPQALLENPPSKWVKEFLTRSGLKREKL